MKNFVFFLTKSPNPNEIKAFEEIISSQDNCRYDFYTGEAQEVQESDLFCICKSHDKIIGYCYAIAFDDYIEVSGLVAPDFRRQGIFSQMLNELNLNGKSIQFSGKDDYPGFLEASAVLGFNNQFHEYLMQCTSPGKTTDLLDFEEEDGTCYFYTDECEDAVGYCSLFDGDNEICIYDVFVYPELRGQGYGTRLVNTVLSLSAGKKAVLHVSEKNTAAVKLYRRCGFKITDSILFITR